MSFCGCIYSSPRYLTFLNFLTSLSASLSLLLLCKLLFLTCASGRPVASLRATWERLCSRWGADHLFLGPPTPYLYPTSGRAIFPSFLTFKYAFTRRNTSNDRNTFENHSSPAKEFEHCVHISWCSRVYRDEMIIFITLLCTDLIGPNPKQCRSKPSFSFLITGVLSKTVFERMVGECWWSASITESELQLLAFLSYSFLTQESFQGCMDFEFVSLFLDWKNMRYPRR